MHNRGVRAALAGVSVLLSVAVVTVALNGTAEATVTVSRAEVSGTRLRIEGSAAAQRSITVDGVAMATSGSTGSFKIDRSGYTSPVDCTVDVSDGTGAPTNTRLVGCTPPPPPPTTIAPAPTTTVSPPTTASIAAVSVGSASVQGGATVAGTVTLTAVAPAGGAAIALSSNNTAAVTVASTMTVPAGVDSFVTFITTNPVTTTQTAVISATYNGVTRTVGLTVTPPPVVPTPTLDLVFLNPAVVQTGTTSTSATIYFSGSTPAGGAFVSLASSDVSKATVPTSITVPGFSGAGAFPVSINVAASGTVTISATYNGVTQSAVLTISATTLFRIITGSPLPNARVGENYAGFIEACCGQGTPYTWSLVSGTVPDGLEFAGDDLRLSRTTGVTGVATRVQTTTFTVRAEDGTGNTATKTFTLTVDPAAPLVITNQSDQLPSGRVGVFYETGVFPGGGVPPYSWTRVAGTLPPGLTVQASPGRVRGTPTTAGTFTFTLRVNDSGGQSATRQFNITITP